MAHIRRGTETVRKAMLCGPDEVCVVLVESSQRHVSILDTDPTKVFSEVHSVVWAVPQLGEELACWASAGFLLGETMCIEEPSISPFLGLSDPCVPIEVAMVSDEHVSPARLELLAFPDRGQPAVTQGTLTTGISAVRFHVPSTLTIGEYHEWAAFGVPVPFIDPADSEKQWQIVAGQTRSGIGVELIFEKE